MRVPFPEFSFVTSFPQLLVKSGVFDASKTLKCFFFFERRKGTFDVILKARERTPPQYYYTTTTRKVFVKSLCDVAFAKKQRRCCRRRRRGCDDDSRLPLSRGEGGCGRYDQHESENDFVLELHFKTALCVCFSRRLNVTPLLFRAWCCCSRFWRRKTVR